MTLKKLLPWNSTDKQAALTLILNALAMDDAWHRLEELLSTTNNVVAIEGDPGWILEKYTNFSKAEHPAWEEDLAFRAYVDSDILHLSYPEYYCRAIEFKNYLIDLNQQRLAEMVIE